MAEKQTNKDRMREIVDSIENGIKELFESDKYRQYLSTMSRFHRYSVNNTMLIYMQRPDATHVAGFNKWRNQFGRNVLKGEKGIRIIAPTPYKKKVEEIKTDPETNTPVLDADGNAVASAEGVEGTLTIPEVHLWEPRPGTPYLYTLHITCGADVYDQTFGVRSIEVRGTQVLLNGKPLYFKGFCKHEDFTAHGRGFDPVLNVKDVNLIHWANANAVRTSHYPYAEEFYDLCDREGILVMDETPAVGIGGGAAVNPYKEYPLAEHHRQVLAEMIHRDKNHPCVVLWSLGNEPDLEHFPQDAYDYWHPLYELAHQLDPQNRPVTLVCCQNDYTKDITTRTMDIVCINRYYGWYNLSGDMDAACYGLNQEMDFWAEQHKPVMMSEYGADTVAGLHTAGAEMFSEEFQVEFYRRLDAEFDKRPWFVGEFVWNFADYDTVQGPMRVDGNKKGLFTRDRRPKLGMHFLRQRWAEIPTFGFKE